MKIDKKQLNDYKNSDINTINKSDVIDINGVEINKSDMVSNRFKNYINSMEILIYSV